jgi:pimeloyl-ACP methyl ester carboxylesterase
VERSIVERSIVERENVARTGRCTSRRATALVLVAAAVSATLAACSSAGGPRPPASQRANAGQPGPPQRQPTAPASARPPAVSVVSAPVRTVRTRLGVVGYRMVGTGPPLVLIMGYTGTMEAWDPRFVDALAAHHRVVIFDNAGIGRTRQLAAPLTIDAMADQTSALIGALGLGRPDVLGWSMGGMIAQALAVRHPAQVRRLVLCATYPGVGTVQPSRTAIGALISGNPQGLITDLFPPDQAAAFSSFAASISRYPAHQPAPAAAAAAQGSAVSQWWAGTDPAGREDARISAPTLVADGTVDRLDPVANAHALARLIPRAQLVLYPDAGHAFLFQEGKRFTSLIESFLAGKAKP